MTQAPKHPEQDAPKTAADQPTEPTARFGRLADSIVTLVLAVLVAFGLGLGAYHFFLAGDDDAGEKAGPSTTANAGHRHGQQAGDEQADLWICSMHPDVTSSGPGLCPICNMELVPATGGSDPTGPLELTPAASQALRIQVAPIERRFVTARIEMIGQVAYDETRIARTTAWIPGRLERLYVDFTGMAVRKGDHMVDIYSPELLAAQAEWIQASRALGTLDSDASEIIRQTTRAGAEAAAGKLQLMGLTDEQIQQIARRGEPSDTLTIYAPQGGIVIRKHAQQGDYVQVGSPIYTIADLQKVWVKFDAYESDVQWLRLGQPVRFSVRSYPGEVFTGRISFLSPTVDPESRTVRVRVTADNENGRLKPQMTVSAIVESQIASGGKVVEPDLADKFLCPMHPSVVSDEPGQCPICQMDLEQAGSLGYAPATGQSQPSLVVPVSAVLWTGKRSVVYVQVKDPESGRLQYYYRQVNLGPRAGGFYLVEEGLAEGELVAVQGNFKIDSQRQIDRMLSMMNPREQATSQTAAVVRGELPEPFAGQLQVVWDRYFELTSRLAADETAESVEAARQMLQALQDIDADPLSADVRPIWKANAETLAEVLATAAAAEDIQQLRKAYLPVSNRMKILIEQFGYPDGRQVHRAHCPMAFGNEGADWLQLDEQIANPYFGSAMLRCGSIEQTYQSASE